jgi:hypothetical protein
MRLNPLKSLKMRWLAKVNRAGDFKGLHRFNLSNCGFILSAKCSKDVSYNLVDRRYGIQEVRGSNPLGSTSLRPQRSEDEGCRAEAHSAQAGWHNTLPAGYGSASQPSKVESADCRAVAKRRRAIDA